MTLTLSLCSRDIGSAHFLTEWNIWVKFNENRLEGSGDMEGIRISRVNPLTLTCDHDIEFNRFICYAHCLTERNIWLKLKTALRVQEISGHEIQW